MLISVPAQPPVLAGHVGSPRCKCRAPREGVSCHVPRAAYVFHRQISKRHYTTSVRHTRRCHTNVKAPAAAQARHARSVRLVADHHLARLLDHLLRLLGVLRVLELVGLRHVQPALHGRPRFDALQPRRHVGQAVQGDACELAASAPAARRLQRGTAAHPAGRHTVRLALAHELAGPPGRARVCRSARPAGRRAGRPYRVGAAHPPRSDRTPAAAHGWTVSARARQLRWPCAWAPCAGAPSRSWQCRRWSRRPCPGPPGTRGPPGQSSTPGRARVSGRAAA